jgi:putative addiction module component (TIGR02574 family)
MSAKSAGAVPACAGPQRAFDTCTGVDKGVQSKDPYRQLQANGTIGLLTTRELRSSALSLPATERAALSHELIVSLDGEPEDSNADGLWAAEIERRAKDIADGRVALIDAEDVHADAAKLLRARAGRTPLLERAKQAQ